LIPDIRYIHHAMVISTGSTPINWFQWVENFFARRDPWQLDDRPGGDHIPLPQQPAKFCEPTGGMVKRSPVRACGPVTGCNPSPLI
jgi:hypothetical protein